MGKTEKGYGREAERWVSADRQHLGCSVCGQAKHHDHTTGKLRDFLCTNCNRGLGHLKDNISHLQSTINYLQKHNDNVAVIKEGT